MLKSDPELFNPNALEQNHHWSPNSEAFASGEALLQALDNGWQVQGVIFRQEFWLAGGRRTYIYHLTLRRDGDVLKMALVYNPFISRFIHRMGVQVVQQNERKSNKPERRPAMV